jgi:hypothetical protein
MVWIRRWLVFAAVVPLVAWTLDRVRESLERRRGHGRLTGSLAKASGSLRRVGGRRRRR